MRKFIIMLIWGIAFALIYGIIIGFAFLASSQKWEGAVGEQGYSSLIFFIIQFITLIPIYLFTVVTGIKIEFDPTRAPMYICSAIICFIVGIVFGWLSSGVKNFFKKE